MKSPFPGMDPFLEASGLWEGFHNHLIEAIYRSLAPKLPKHYFASTATRSYVVVEEGEVDNLEAPVVVQPEDSAGFVSMEAFLAEKFCETFVEIYLQAEERFLVTCIEVLSPSNKRLGTEGWKEYARKRQAMLLGRANFIELDLLRGGTKMPMRTPWPDAPYSLLVARDRSAPRCRVWPAHFNTPLPPIPVPLFDPDPDIRLDLQPLIDEIYALGRYSELLHYERPLEPALSEADAAWVRERLRQRS